MATIDFDSVLKSTSKFSQRGKSAEKSFRAECETHAKRSNFDFERLHDARSSQGHMSAVQTGDFAIYYKGRPVMVEVKEVDHSYRLPAQNFPREQRNRMLKRKAAGCMCVVAIHFTEIKKWRFVDIEVLANIDRGSWDFRGFSTCTVGEGMQAIINAIDKHRNEEHFENDIKPEQASHASENASDADIKRREPDLSPSERAAERLAADMQKRIRSGRVGMQQHVIDAEVALRPDSVFPGGKKGQWPRAKARSAPGNGPADAEESGNHGGEDRGPGSSQAV